MVIVSRQQEDGTYIVRGRASRDQARVPCWPCSKITLKKFADPRATDVWLDEAAAYALECLNEGASE